MKLNINIRPEIEEFWRYFEDKYHDTQRLYLQYPESYIDP